MIKSTQHQQQQLKPTQTQTQTLCTLENSETKTKIPLLLENTPQKLGRGVLLNILDKKVSKEQIELFTTTTKDIIASVRSIGENPTFVKKSSGEVIVLTTGDVCEIQQGDTLVLVLPEYSFIVRTSNTTQKKPVEEEVTLITSESPRKRKMDQTDDGVRKEKGKGKEKEKEKEKEPLSRDAFSILMEKKPPPPITKESQKTTTKAESSSKRVVGGGSWSDVLSVYCFHPEKHNEEVFYFDDQVVVIYDKFPKARFHYLVMPRKLVDGFKDLTREDIPMVEMLWERGKAIVNEVKEKVSNSIEFQVGFHAVPSMRQLHMHVISRDFNSPSLKHKKHWNSFTTKFFVNTDIFIQHLRDHNKIDFDKEEYEGLLKVDLMCHICKSSISTFPALKDHIKSCTKKRL